MLIYKVIASLFAFYAWLFIAIPIFALCGNRIFLRVFLHVLTAVLIIFCLVNYIFPTL